FPLQLMEFFGPSLSVGGALLMLLIQSLLTLSRAAQPFFHLRQGDAAGELVLLLLYPQYLAQPQLALDLSSPRLGGCRGGVGLAALAQRLRPGNLLFLDTLLHRAQLPLVGGHPLAQPLALLLVLPDPQAHVARLFGQHVDLGAGVLDLSVQMYDPL